MFIRNKYLKFIFLFFLFVISTIAIDRFFIQGVTSFKTTDEARADSGIYSYAFFPFYEFSGETPARIEKDGWVVSHPIGIGDYIKIISIKIPGLPKKTEVKCQTFLDFADGYKERVSWEKMSFKDGLYYVNPVRKSPFLQIALRNTDKKKLSPDAVIVTVEMKLPIGLLNIAGSEAYMAMQEIREDSTDSLFAPVFFDKPLRAVKLDESYEIYRLINILNGLNCNVIGEIDLGLLNSSEIRNCIKIYKDSIKVWKLSDVRNVTRENAGKVLSSIFNNSSSSLVIWEDNGILTNVYSQSGTKDWSPVKLNRGTIWTCVIFLSCIFLITGTIRIFELSLSYDHLIFKRCLSYIPMLVLIFLLPLFAEGINLATGLGLLKALIIGASWVFLIEFIRCLLLKSGEYIGVKSKLIKLKKMSSLKTDSILIVASSVLVAFLSAGYPGFSTFGSILFVIANAISGLFFGSWFVKHRSLLMNLLVHYISAVPFIVLIGKF